MNNKQPWQTQASKHYQALLWMNGSAVLLIGLIAGVLLIFAMVGGYVIWPIMDIPADLPGSVRGWKAAHVGGMMNGLLIIVIGLLLSKIPLSFASMRFVTWSFVLTGWGNTVFYWAGNLAPNRGVSFEANTYGEASTYGVIAFFGGGSVMLLTIIATGLLMRGAFKLMRTG